MFAGLAHVAMAGVVPEAGVTGIVQPSAADTALVFTGPAP